MKQSIVPQICTGNSDNLFCVDPLLETRDATE